VLPEELAVVAWCRAAWHLLFLLDDHAGCKYRQHNTYNPHGNHLLAITV